MKKLALAFMIMMAIASPSFALNSCYVKHNHTPLLEKPFDTRSMRAVEYLDNKPATFVFLQGEEFYDYDHDDDFWLVETQDGKATGWVRRSWLYHCVRGTHPDEYTKGGRQ
jgi:hypothetical protein